MKGQDGAAQMRTVGGECQAGRSLLNSGFTGRPAQSIQMPLNDNCSRTPRESSPPDKILSDLLRSHRISRNAGHKDAGHSSCAEALLSCFSSAARCAPCPRSAGSTAAAAAAGCGSLCGVEAHPAVCSRCLSCSCITCQARVGPIPFSAPMAGLLTTHTPPHQGVFCALQDCRSSTDPCS